MGFLVILSVFLVLSSKLPSSTALCGPSGSVYNEWHEWNGHWFIFIQIRKTWPQANDACPLLGRGAHLARLNDTDLFGFTGFMQQHNEPTGHPLNKYSVNAHGVVSGCSVLTWLQDGTPTFGRLCNPRERIPYICERSTKTIPCTTKVPASVITPIHTYPTLDLPHSVAASVGPQFYSGLARPPYSAAYPSYSGPALHHPFIRHQLPHSA